MRDVADGTRLRRFLNALAHRVRGPGTLYLVGGSSAVWEGWRETTIDVDMKAEPEPLGLFEAIAELKNELGINVELASPDQFIPALPGWQDRSPILEKHADVVFRHYDFYGQALAKIERGHGRDLFDAEAMVKRAWVHPPKLLELFEAIEPGLIRFPSIDPSRFRRDVLAFCTRMAAGSWHEQ